VLAGSATYPLDVIAGLSPDRSTVRIAVINATFKPQFLAIKLQGITTRAKGNVWRLTGISLDAGNQVGKPPGVSILQSTVPALSRGLTLPPISTSIYEFPVSNSR
jgi:alpha-N-arabinofuranosidase